MRNEVVDVACGSKMFYFDKDNPDVLFLDNRELETVLCDGRPLTIKPDRIADFRNLDFEDESFNLVIFDPPHITHAGKNSWIGQKYGCLDKNTWREDIWQGFSECWRVLKKGGTLIFKWSEVDIKVNEILKLTPAKPLLGHRSGKRANTHWLVFYKSVE